MKRILYLILSVIFVSFPFSNKLLGQIVLENKVSFNELVHDFGDILISDGKQTCVFKMKNISNVPILIHRVIASCGCTQPYWTKTPIKPNETGEIKITYLNDQGPYPFNKSITVYVGGLSKPVILKVRGAVYKTPQTLQALFQVRYGSIGFREKKINMGWVEQGLSSSMKIEVANLTNRETKIDFANCTPGLSITMENKKIPAKSKREFTCTINTSKTSEKKWGKNSFTFTLINKGRKYKEALDIKVSIKENFIDLTESQKRVAPLSQFNTTSIEFGTVPAGKILEGDYIFRNIGKEPFIIHKVDSSESGIEITYGGAVSFGEEGRVHIKIDTKGKPAGEMLSVLTLITNSPIRPIINLFAVYNIEK